MLEIMGCIDCGVEAVTGGDGREHGYPLFSNNLAERVSILAAVRLSVQEGMAIGTLLDGEAFSIIGAPRTVCE